MLQLRFAKILTTGVSQSYVKSIVQQRSISNFLQNSKPTGRTNTVVNNIKNINKDFVRPFSTKDDNAPNKRVSLVMLGNPVNSPEFKISTPEKVLVVPSKRPIFPQSWFPLEFSDPDYAKQLRTHLEKTPLVGIFVAKEGNDKALTNTSQVEEIGVLCYTLNLYQGHNFFYFHALKRIKITGVSDPENPLFVNIAEVEDQPYKEDKEFKAIYTELTESLDALVKQQESGQGYPQYYFQPYQSVSTMKPSQVADMAAGRCINANREDLLPVLLETNVKNKLNAVLTLVKKELEIYDIKKNINKQIEENIQKTHRKYLLTEQLKTIKKELGLEQDEKKALVDKFNDRMKNMKVPEHAMKVIKDEMQKLSTLDPSALEFNMTRTYLDWLTSIPWGVHSVESFDVKKAAKILDEDHYGLQDVKERILEFIAVGKLRKGIQGKIMCLAGPPGVGKTSIGKSIARALNREFYRFSVGGLGDISEIKGHRRTYVGSMPGKIIQCLKQVKTENPVILIDEIDKLSRAGYHGDPAAALLEVLDPAQNNTFMDHYLDIPVDISKVLFVCTANVKENIPGPLIDRMEVINLSGYILEEKMSIAKKYLVPTIRDESGLLRRQVNITDGALSALIRDYCREAGVRNLQKQIEKMLRKVAHKVVAGHKYSTTITEQNLSTFVGKPVFNSDRYYKDPISGVIMGLAWTAMGGATLYVETVVDKVGHKAEMRTTGQLGDVMKESTNIAYTYAKSFIDEVNHGNRFFELSSLHMHIPEGATPKDGPSAGITMVTSLISLALNKPVINNLAMTGELTLTGKVLPIGGVKEKTIAAKRSGVKHIIFPIDNKKDWDELPEHIKKGLNVNFADYYKDVYAIAFKDDKFNNANIKDAKIIKKKETKPKTKETKKLKKENSEKKVKKEKSEKKEKKENVTRKEKKAPPKNKEPEIDEPNNNSPIDETN